MGLYSGMIEPCPQILDKAGSDRKWQTLYNTATITAVKSFIVQAPGGGEIHMNCGLPMITDFFQVENVELPLVPVDQGIPGTNVVKLFTPVIYES